MTYQIPDSISIDGLSTLIASFCDVGQGAIGVPRQHPGIESIPFDVFVREATGSLLFSTACQRNYIAQWSIRDDRLHLDAIEGIYRLRSDTAIFADWFSGAFFVQDKDAVNLQTEPMWNGVYNREIYLHFRRGQVVFRQSLVYPDLDSAYDMRRQVQVQARATHESRRHRSPRD